jgi:hypothetical protein
MESITFDEFLHKFKSDKVLVPFIHSDKTYYKIKISIHNVIELLILIQCYVLVKIDPTHIDDRIFKFAETAELFDKAFSSAKFDAHFRNAITVLLGVGGLDITDVDANIHNEIVKSHFIELNNILQIKSVNLCRLNKTIQEVKQVATNIITQGIEITDHRSSIDLISVEVDNTIQTLTKLEQLHELQIDDIQNRISSMESMHSIQYQTHETTLNEHQKIIELNMTSLDNINSEIIKIENIQSCKYEQLQADYITLLGRLSYIETSHKTHVGKIENMEHQLENSRQDIKSYALQCKQANIRLESIEIKMNTLNKYNEFLINCINCMSILIILIVTLGFWVVIYINW